MSTLEPGSDSLSTSSAPHANLRPWAAAAIAVAALVAYWPSLSGGLLFDDDGYVMRNPMIHAPDGLQRIWFTTEPIDYWPVTNSSFWIEWRLWGRNPTGYHVTNLVLHVASCLLLWTILSRLGVPGAWLAALLFAIHPVNVDSVAWVAQRKNMLSMFFFLLSLLWYLKSEGSRREPSGPGAPGARLAGRPGWYWLSLVAFTLAMLSKGSVAGLPVLLLLIVWWQYGRVTKRDLIRSAPFFVVAVILAAVNVWFMTRGQSIRNLSFLERLLGAGAVPWFYLYKAYVPLNLSFCYRPWLVDPGSLRWWLPLAAILGVTVVLLAQRHTWWGRPLLLAWLFFCIALGPVLGFTDVGFMRFSQVADHYQYVALIAPVTLAAAACGLLYRRGGAFRSVSVVGVAAVLALFLVLTWRHSTLYAHPIALYRAALIDNPNSPLLLMKLGFEFNALGDYRAASEVLQRAVLQEDLPFEGNARNNLAAALIGQGKFDEAAEQLNRLVRDSIATAETQLNLGVIASRYNRDHEAIEHFEAALQLKPDYPEAHSNLARALALVGRAAEAVQHGKAAVRLNPEIAAAHSNYGHALFEAGQEDAAMEQFQETIRIDPTYVSGYLNLAETYARSGRLADAVSMARQALGVAQARNQAAMIGEIERRLKDYEARLNEQQSESPAK